MRYAWVREPRLDIRRAVSPQVGSHLSGVALVSGDGIGYCYIAFDRSVVQQIGSKMPYGIGLEHPAYLHVIAGQGGYDVYCCYLDKSKRIALWRSAQRPAWVWRVKCQES